MSENTHNLNTQPDSNTEKRELLAYLELYEKQLYKQEHYILSENDIDFEK